MKYFNYVLLLFALFLSASSAWGHVLVINSYHRTFPWTDELVSSIEESFKNEKIELHVEYLDTKEHNFEEPYITHLKNLFRFKLLSPFGAENDLIIVSDDNALKFVLLFYDELFAGKPVVFTGINDKEMAEKIDRKKVTGVFETESPKENIDLILKLHPKTRRIVMIFDTTPSGEYRWNQFKQYFADYPEMSFERIWGGESLLELENYLTSLGEDTVVIFGTYYRDGTGRYVSLSEGVERLTLASNRPIYTTHKQIIKYGTVGGKLLGSDQQGKKAAEMALRILGGESPEEIPLVSEELTQYIFNYDQLTRFDIPQNLLPEGSIILGQPFNLYEQYAHYFWIGVAILTTLLLFISLLLLNTWNQARANKALYQSSNIDSLTGLYNRHYFNNWLQSRSKTDQPFSLYILDIDYFRYMKDAFGQKFGDKILIEFSNKIDSAFTEPDRVFRLEVDRFAVVCYQNTEKKDPVAQLHDSFQREAIELNNGGKIKLLFSAGSAKFRPGSDPNTLLKQAETALFRAKQEGGNRILSYQGEFSLEFELLAKAKESIGHLFDKKEKVPFHFQPIVQLDKDEVVGYEMLLRLRDSTGKLLPPQIAITACAQAGYSRELSIHAFESAFTFLRGAGKNIFVSVNLSKSQLLVSELSQDIKELAEAHQVSLCRLVIEVTEESSLESKQIIEALHLLRGMGTRIALDDFGTGYSSIANMKKLPLDFAKLDKAFLFDPELRTTIASASELCKSIGLRVIVEGVEHLEDETLCKSIACDYGQGYFYGRPLPAEEIL